MLQHYRIAGLTVAMDTFGRTLRQAEAYRIPESGDGSAPAADSGSAPADGSALANAYAPDITIVSRRELLQQRHPYLDEDRCEYMATGADFYRQLLRYDGLMIHASAVVVDGRAYLFSAPSGTGKSTHTALWRQVFGDRAVILNDDKPAVRLENGTFYAYGTPWSGKTDQNRNLRVPLAGVCVLARGEENRIAPYGGAAAFHDLLRQTVRPRDPAAATAMMNLLPRLIDTVPVWRMECNMDPEAARVAYAAMAGDR